MNATSKDQERTVNLDDSMAEEIQEEAKACAFMIIQDFGREF